MQYQGITCGFFRKITCPSVQRGNGISSLTIEADRLPTCPSDETDVLLE